MSLRLSLQGSTEAELASQAVDFLLQRGYVVEMPGAWESQQDFCARIGLSPRQLRRRLRRRKFMPQVDLDEGPNGRLIRLRSNSAFESWVKAGKHC